MVMHRKIYFMSHKGTKKYDTDGKDAVVKHYKPYFSEAVRCSFTLQLHETVFLHH